MISIVVYRSLFYVAKVDIKADHQHQEWKTKITESIIMCALLSIINLCKT